MTSTPTARREALAALGGGTRWVMTTVPKQNPPLAQKISISSCRDRALLVSGPNTANQATLSRLS